MAPLTNGAPRLKLGRRFDRGFIVRRLQFGCGLGIAGSGLVVGLLNVLEMLR